MLKKLIFEKFQHTMFFIFQSVNEENDLEFVYEDADEFNTEIAGETMVGFLFGEPGISKGSGESVHLCRFTKAFFTLPSNMYQNLVLLHMFSRCKHTIIQAK